MGKWTPGPWSLNDDQRHVGSDGVTLVGEVAKLNLDEFARVAADRRLIAEAPAMAEVLKEWADRVGPRWFLEQNWAEPLAILSRINGDAP